MMIKGYYDDYNKKLVLDYSCNLLKDYYELFQKTFEDYRKSGVISEAIELQRMEETKCLILISIEIPGTEKLQKGNRVGAPRELLTKISSALEDFKTKALQKELGNTEFIPLMGYPIEDLKSDIIEAIKNKRDFCLIDEFSEYKKFTKRETTKLQQYKVKYNTNDYSEVSLYIYKGDLKGLKKQYLPLLEEVDWE